MCDVGCGEGRLLRRLLESPAHEVPARLLGTDVSSRALKRATRVLSAAHADAAVRAAANDSRPPPELKLTCGSLLALPPSAIGCEVLTLVEVVEHLDPPALEAVGDALLGRCARLAMLVVIKGHPEAGLHFQ